MKFWQVVLILSVIVQIQGFSLTKASAKNIIQVVETKNNLSGINEIHLLSQNGSLLVQDYAADENDVDEEVVLSEENTFDVNVEEIFEGRIVGGEPTNIQKFPHQVSLQLNQKHMCGGAILSANVVITAAHCVLYPVKSKYYSIRVGSSQHDYLGQVLLVKQIIIHPQYGPVNNDKDVALLVLARNLNFTNEIQPVRLPDTQDQLIDGMELLVSGWGVRGASQLAIPRVLHYAAVKLINHDMCRRSYQPVQPITPNMICAGARGKDSCQGDSGGPLVKSIDGVNTLYGIVSFGIGCANPRYPGVYSNVILLKPWVQANLNFINNS